MVPSVSFAGNLIITVLISTYLDSILSEFLTRRCFAGLLCWTHSP